MTPRDELPCRRNIEAAAQETKTKFQIWCKTLLGLSVSGTKADMVRQAREFMDRIEVTRQQSSF